MHEPKIMTTAKRRDGTMHTDTDCGWAMINSCKASAISKRRSLRKKQIREGLPAYSLEHVVGTLTDEKPTYPRKPKAAVRRKEIRDMRSAFSRRALV